MWCKNCEKEFEAQETCPVCGAVLTERPKDSWSWSGNPRLLEKWPRTAEGTPEAPVFLRHAAATNMEAEMIVNMLDAYGIPCLQEYYNDGSFGRVILGTPGTGVWLYVPESLLEDAQALIEVEDAEDEEV